MQAWHRCWTDGSRKGRKPTLQSSSASSGIYESTIATPKLLRFHSLLPRLYPFPFPFSFFQYPWTPPTVNKMNRKSRSMHFCDLPRLFDGTQNSKYHFPPLFSPLHMGTENCMEFGTELMHIEMDGRSKSLYFCDRHCRWWDPKIKISFFFSTLFFHFFHFPFCQWEVKKHGNWKMIPCVYDLCQGS